MQFWLWFLVAGIGAVAIGAVAIGAALLVGKVINRLRIT